MELNEDILVINDAMNIENTVILKLLLNKLTELQKNIVYKIFIKGHSVTEIAKELHISRQKGENYITRVSSASNWGADLYIEFHLNCGGGNGAEIYTWKGQEIKEARNVLNSICKLGYKNRGIKDGSQLYVIKNTKCTAFLVECFFCDSQKDTNLYDVNLIAEAIAKGISGQAFLSKKNINTKSKTKYTVNYCLEFQKWYNNVTKTRAPISQDGIYGANTEKAMQTIQNIIREF